MKQITYISILLLLLVSSYSYGQLSLGRQTLGTTGGYAIGTNITVSSTVGEAVVQTIFSTNLILTQGFQQVFAPSGNAVDFELINESCRGSKNGSIFISNVLGCPGPYTIDITMVGDTSNQYGADTLSTGNYVAVITGGNGCVFPLPFFVGLDSDEGCVLKFYSGFTPNGDERNDSWIIDNIEQFPENIIQIFNRWGNEVWSGKNYDNDKVVWKGNNGNKDDGAELTNATYFYVAIVEGFDTPFKGWVELTR